MPDTRAPYRAPHGCPLPSGSVHPERVDERAARMLGCSSRHAKALRLSEIAESITAILAACHDDPAKGEAFRRHCLTALSAEPAPDLTPDLIVEAATVDAKEDAAAMAAQVNGMTETERRHWLRQLREELGSKSNLIRALENR